MKKALLLVLGLCLIASSAFAQPGAIMLYSDNVTFANCDLTDAAPGLLSVFAVHNFTAGATAAQFGIQSTHTMSYLAYASAHQVNVGNDPNTGVAVTYDAGCSAGPILLGTISYFASGTSPPCSGILVVADEAAASGQIEGVDCGFVSTFPDASNLTVNTDGVCPCGRSLPIEESNWGRVKALYN